MPYQPRATFDNPYGPQITFRTQDLLPPTAYYLNPDDGIRIAAMSNQASTLVHLTMRILTPQGEVKVEQFQQVIQPVSSPTQLALIPPTEGYLLGAVMWADGPASGQCFVQITLFRGSLSTEQLGGQVILQGYVSSFAYLNYPPSVIDKPYEGAGALGAVVVNPGQGNPVLFTVPSSTRWRVRSLLGQLFTDGTAGNRTPFLVVSDNAGNPLVNMGSGATSPPSSSLIYTWAPGCQFSSVAGRVVNPLPIDWLLGPGYSINLSAGGGAPADTWQPGVLYKEEWVGD